MAPLKTGGDQTGMPLNRDTLLSLQCAKVFNDNEKHITSLDFDWGGELCITASEDDTMHVYDCQRGVETRLVRSAKYGCHLARFTHKSSTIIYASTKQDHAIRYMSLHDNKFLKYFRGHEDRVVSLEMSPQNDNFLSGSMDGTVRVWDLGATHCQGRLSIPDNHRPSVAWDQSGQVFAVAYSNIVKLYGINSFDKGPFETFKIPKHPGDMPLITAISFSNDGNRILVSTAGQEHYVLNAFKGFLTHKLVGHFNENQEELVAGFTPDSRFVLCGSQTGGIHFWDLGQSPTDGQNESAPPEHRDLTVKSMSECGGHEDTTRAVGFNPKYAMMVTADSSLVCFFFVALDWFHDNDLDSP
ncbi:WD repeat-containing protein 82 [Rhizophlyctis rosea]|uniref:WD repeat-containing protein 82 n=1 Tax=Rhizophlyctis rosea TaxID=64517 RepID=A0AAD5SB31_9FUNG|nr:WD repeat-containing protein 82 [Rhizophlyctis rosea]